MHSLLPPPLPPPPLRAQTVSDHSCCSIHAARPPWERSEEEGRATHWEKERGGARQLEWQQEQRWTGIGGSLLHDDDDVCSSIGDGTGLYGDENERTALGRSVLSRCGAAMPRDAYDAAQTVQTLP